MQTANVTIPLGIESDTCQQRCVSNCVCHYRNQLLVRRHVAAKRRVVGRVPEALTIWVEVLMIQLGYTRLTYTQVGPAILQTGPSIRTRPAVAARRLSDFWEEGIAKVKVIQKEEKKPKATRTFWALLQHVFEKRQSFLKHQGGNVR